MERLTKRSDFTGLVLIDGKGYGEAYFGAKEDYDRITKALNKLAAYEDTEEQGRLVVLPEPTPDIDFMRIFNLIMADAEDRVIVLPCKVGARVYKVVKTWGTVPICCPCGEYKGMQKCSYLKENGNISVCTAEAQEDTDGFINGVVSLMFDFDMLPEIGKTVFLSREEAEAALKGGTNGRNL